MGFLATMSNQKTVEIRLEGNVPSKKNQRINTKDGLSFPSKKFTQWQNDALTQVRLQTRTRFFKPVSIEVIIYFATLTKADVDNRLTSILDMLTESLLIRDDQWEHVPLMKAQAEYRPRNPGAFIRITELEDGFLGEEHAIDRAKLDRKKRK